MGRHNYSLKDFRVKVTAIHCQNRSIDYAYSVPDCADYATIIVCKGASRTGYWCPSQIISYENNRLPQNGTQSIEVDKYKVVDTLYAVALGANADYSQCPSSFKTTFFDFTNCQKTFTTPETTEETNDSARNHHIMTTKMANPSQTASKHLLSHPQFNFIYGLLILFGILAVVFLSLVIYYIHKKRSSTLSPKLLKNSHEAVTFINNLERQGIVPPTSIKMPIVYIVFVEDSPQHTNVLIAFANYLQEDLGFSVIFQLWETQKASENYYAWMQNSMESADKIIVVWSDGAGEKLRTFKENKLDFPDTFSPVVQHMQNSLFKYKNVSKYSLVYFSYSDKTSIPNQIFNKTEFRHFELMRDFEELYFNLMNIEKHQPGHIHHFPKTNVKLLFNPKVTKNGPALKKAIKNASKQNSLYLNETESSESINTDTDDMPNSATNNYGLASIANRFDHFVTQRSISLPSLAAKAETFKRRTMSMASIEGKLEHVDPEHFLHEINYLTQRQEFIHNWLLLTHEQSQKCDYHHTS